MSFMDKFKGRDQAIPTPGDQRTQMQYDEGIRMDGWQPASTQAPERTGILSPEQTGAQAAGFPGSGNSGFSGSGNAGAPVSGQFAFQAPEKAGFRMRTDLSPQETAQIADLYRQLGEAYYAGGFEDPLPQLLPLFDQISGILMEPIPEPPKMPAASAGTCASCGAPLMEGARFCEECGAPVDAEPAPQTRFCPVCGAQLGANAKFCGKCGAKL